MYRKDAYMKHGLVSVSGYDFFSQYDLSFCDLVDEADKLAVDKAWNALMGNRGFILGQDIDVLRELFDLICSEFAATYGKERTISLREGYITKDRGQTPARHNEVSRIFSQSKSIYIDLLMSNVLFEYAAAFYLWARHPENEDLVSRCFIHTLYTLEGCCRRGKLSEMDGQLSLQKLIADNLDDQEIVFIGDLYWCMLSFAMCHEIAHLYCEHGCPRSTDDGYIQEFQADAVGYDVYLKLMIKNMHSTENVSSGVFREYLYTAPMILLLFYHDLFAMGYWMYGEVIYDTHPVLKERIDKLLAISQDDKYEFDSSSGNVVLNCYYDISDKFLVELWYKLKNGKLSDIVRKGASSVTGKAFEDACAFDETICKKITEQAPSLGYDARRLIGLWNMSAQVSADSFGDNHGLVTAIVGKAYSIKGLNVIYNQKVLLESVIEMGLTIAKPGDIVETIRTALYIIYKIALIGTIEIKDVHAELLKACHINKAYAMPIKEDALLARVPKASSDDITELDRLGCIELVDGYVHLREKVVLE